jgi:hypothetical protein
MFSLVGFGPSLIKIYDEDKTWGLYYKTFYGRRLQIFVISGRKMFYSTSPPPWK